MSSDPDARRVWDEVERSCGHLRAAGESDDGGATVVR
jgi:hypothetical protein